MPLAKDARFWTTPQAHDVTERGSGQQPTAAAGNACLARDARTWATPDCNTSTYSNGKMGPNIREQASQWATPQARDCKNPDSAESGNYQRKLEQGYTIDLNSQAHNWWPTPAARDHKGANSEQHATVTGGDRKHMDQLANFVAYSPLAQAIQDGPESLPPSPGLPQPSTKRLNPYFAERLMGWPLGWTSATAPSASSASETALWRCKLQQHLSCLLEGQDL